MVLATATAAVATATAASRCFGVSSALHTLGVPKSLTTKLRHAAPASAVRSPQDVRVLCTLANGRSVADVEGANAAAVVPLHAVGPSTEPAGDTSPPRRSALLGSASLASGLLSLGQPTPAGAISREEKRIADLFEKVTPSVVSIGKSPPQVGGLSEERVTNIYGTGFVWDNEHVVTNYHVINGMDKPYVTFLIRDPRTDLDRRTTLESSIVGTDAASDVAVLKVSTTTKTGDPAPKSIMAPLNLGRSTNLLVGQDVFAFGNPFGLEHSLSRGIISGVSRTMEGAGGRPISGIIQTDASINPGNSGGPLLDSDGKVIGVNTAILSGSGTFAGVGLAIPMDLVAKNVESIISKGFVRRPFLGIVFAPDVMSEELSLNGIMVMKVVQGGPAEKAGVRPMRGGKLGDILVSFDGMSVSTSEDLFKYLDKRKPGDNVTLQVQRASVDIDSDKYQDVKFVVELGGTNTPAKKKKEADSED